MRGIVLGGAVAAGLLGAILGRGNCEPLPKGAPPQYERVPTASDFETFYPKGAALAGTAGTTVLCCTPLPDRTLDCKIAFETPPDLGFGPAALKISKAFMLTQVAYEERKSGPALRVPITFLVGDSEQSKEFEATLPKIREATADACKQAKPAT